MRRRLDLEMVRRSMAPTRAQAKQLIDEGKVRVAGAPTTNAARLVEAGEPIQLAGPPARYVSRGGEKLEAALEHFAIDVQGKAALDVGASTGGFTDCLLQHGATSVLALDVGTAQLHERIRRDERVEVLEQTNIRHVTKDDLTGAPFHVITADVSFISLKTIAPQIADVLAAPGADVVVLIKPQFEAGRAEVSKGKGVVGGSEIWRKVLAEVLSATTAVGAATMGVMVSPLLGAQGNVEFLAHLRAHQTVDPENPLIGVDLDAVLDAAERHRNPAYVSPIDETSSSNEEG